MNSLNSKKGYELIDNYVDSLNKEELPSLLSKLLKENDSSKKILDNLISSFVKVNSDDQIIEENWDWFVETLNQVKDTKEFKQFCRKINIRLYVLSHFTKIKFKENKYIEDELKFQLKKYFNSVRADTKSKFVENLYDLPFEFSSLLVRFFVNTLETDDEKKTYKGIKSIADTYLKELLSLKNDFVKQINDISLGLYSNVSYEKIKELLELRAFYNYNALNAGALEFIVRFINSRESELKEKYGQGAPNYLKGMVFSFPCYVFHIKRVKEGKDLLFFLDNGTQNEKKKVTFDNYVKQVLEPKNYIPTDKVIDIDQEVDQDENPENSPEEGSENEGSSSFFGGGSSSSGSLSSSSSEEFGGEEGGEENLETEEPSEEELMEPNV